MSTEQYFLKGKYKLSTTPHEMRMSHWVYAPVIINTDNDEVILNLEGNIWDFRSAKETRDSIILKLARYSDGNKEYEMKLQLSAKTVTINGAMYPLASVPEVLDAIV